MALKDIIKSTLGSKPVEVNNQESVEMTLASDQFPVIRESDVDMSRYTKVPLAGLATLGGVFAQLPDAARTVTSTMTKAIDLPGKLYVGLNPKGVLGTVTDFGNGISGNIMRMNKQGKNVIAGRMRFKEVTHLNETVTTLAPVDPMTMAIAAALFTIEQKLDALQKTAEEILQFLKRDKQSRQRGNLNMLSEIMDEYKRGCNDEKLCSLRANAVQDIKREAQQDILFYQEQINQQLQDQAALHGLQQAETLAEQVLSEFYEYQLACYLYGYSTFMEVMLQKNYESVLLDSAVQKMQIYAERYAALHGKCCEQLIQYRQSSVEVKLLGGLGSVIKSVGEKIAAVPLLSNGTVDEALIQAGESMNKFSQETAGKRLERFEALADDRMGNFVNGLKTIDVLCNQPNALLVDGETLYMLNIA